LLQKLFQTWILERIFEKKRNNKLEKEKADLFLETYILEAKCLQISTTLSISFPPLSTFATFLYIIYVIFPQDFISTFIFEIKKIETCL